MAVSSLDSSAVSVSLACWTDCAVWVFPDCPGLFASAD
ncbi:hypothetical protein EVA_12389 [gut metagenome]|uniref:Uncharacterized protein n=1 Tax=gut metagenome TaxID=749906 RepID=J9CHE8_9ZZZZ